MVSHEQAVALRQVFKDPLEFVPRLKIRDTRNRTRPIGKQLWPEQEPWLECLLSDTDKYVIGLKPRQVGYTTLTQAVLFFLAYTSGDAFRALSMAHEDKAQKRMRQMVRTFYAKLPRELRFGIDVDNVFETTFAHNGAGLDRTVAGGRGQGRAYTYNWFHATEMGFWPRGSAASGRSDDEAGGVDETAFASVTATLHDERSKIIVESTGNGPEGLFYELWREATEPGSRWRRVFVPWTSVARYRETLTDEQAQALEADLDDDERELVTAYGLELEQIAWRRTKMRTERWTSLRFRREYPATDQDPFLLTLAGWFDQVILNAALRAAPNIGDTNDALVRFLPYEPGRKYFLGADTSGGVGKDHAVVHILRDDLAHAARWASNTADPIEQALMINRLGREYGRPLALIEANKYGQVVIPRVQACTLWKTPDDKDFWSTGDRAGANKRDALTVARDLVNRRWAAPRCSHTLRQMLRIVEKSTGKIEGAGRSHDDFAMAYVFALYAAKDAFRLHLRPPETRTPDRIGQILRRYGGTTH